MIIIDTHTHAGRNWFEPVEMLIHQMNLNGVERAVLIQHGRPETGGYEQDYLFECVERFPGRFAVIVIVDVNAHDALTTLEGFANRGAVGVRLNPDQRSPDDDPLAVWRKANELGLFISSMGGVESTASDEFRALVGQFPNMPFIVEHLAGAGENASFPENGEGPKPPYTMFRKALDLAKLPNTYMKVHGLGEICPRPQVLKATYDFDFYDSVPPLYELAKEAFGVQRIMWGSDYPPVSQREGYRNSLLGAMNHPAFDSQNDKEWVMGKTALSVIKFDA